MSTPHQTSGRRADLDESISLLLLPNAFDDLRNYGGRLRVIRKFISVSILFFAIDAEALFSANEPCRRTITELSIESNRYNRQFRLSADEAISAFAILTAENDPTDMQMHLQRAARHTFFGDASVEEIAAVYHYMTNQGYSDVNRYLRGLPSSKSAAANDAQARLMVSCMNRMPQERIVSGVMVYRATALSRSVLDASYPVGRIIEEAAFLSSSLDKTFVNSSFGLNPQGDQVTAQFTIRSMHGRAIAEGYEKEVIFYPGTHFKVVSKNSATSWDGKPIALITLEEIDSSDL